MPDHSARATQFTEQFRQMLEDATSAEHNPSLALAREQMLTAHHEAIELSLRFRPAQEVQRAIDRLQEKATTYAATMQQVLEPIVQQFVRLVWDAYHKEGAPYGNHDEGIARWLNEQEELDADDAVTWAERFLRELRRGETG